MSGTKRKQPLKAQGTPDRRSANARARQYSGGEFYARALAIERQAAERYRDFARHMAVYGNARTAELFLRLARFEAEHAERLLEKTAGMKLPRLARGGRGAASGPSEVASYEFLYRRVLPHHALLMALAGERRAKNFFEQVRLGATDPEIRKLAAEFAREETEHIAWLEEALAREPQPAHPIDELFDLAS